MKKRILSVALIAVMTLSFAFTGCGNNSASDGGGKQGSNGKTVGVAMPTQSSERWIKDGRNMKARLEELGYEVFLQYAEDDVQVQLAQIETMIAKDVDCLVVAAVDSSALINALQTAKEVGIPVISYDRLLMNTDAVSYYASFDNEGVGRKIGEYIEEKANLAEAEEPQTIEFFMGSPDDNNAVLLYKGVMSVLQPYLDDGTLVCKSGRTSFDDTCILRWSQEVALQNCENYLSGFYANDKLDICCSAFDGFAYGIKAALEAAGYTEEDWPIITGQDAEVMAVKNIIEGKQTATIFKNTELLAEKCAGMVQAVNEGIEPEINDTETYDNGKMVVPSYLCEPLSLDKDNYKELVIDSGYYKEEEIRNAN